MVSTITSFTDQECLYLIDQLKSLDPKIQEKVFFVKNHTNVKIQEALEFVVNDEPTLWAKVYLNWEARNYQKDILGQSKKAKKLVLRLGRRLGKCLPGYVEIPDSVTGEYLTVEELYYRQEVNVFALDEKMKTIESQKTNVIFENGIKPVYRITVESGRTVDLTGNHPLYTPDGYVEVDDLSEGELVALASKMRQTSPREFPDAQFRELVRSNLRNGVPKEAFLMSRRQLREYLHETTHYDSGKSLFYFFSEKAAKDFQRLFLRVGLNTSLSRDEEIGCFELKKVDNLSEEGDLVFEKIVSIVPMGEMQTYDLTVPNYHSFVANDFVTHNTESECVSILWHAFTQPNRGQNDVYDILILAPFETQIDLIFTRLEQLIANSPILMNEISRSINHRYEWKNGTNIQGLTVGSGNGKAGASTRGQRADLLVFDEQDYIDSDTMTNVLNIANEDRGRIKIISASTPSGRHDEFYTWCTEASVRLHPIESDLSDGSFHGYVETRSGHGNGWTEIYAPSTVNETILEINPDTNQSYLNDIKDELTDQRYQQEVLALFGEEAMGVYKKEHIQRAMELSIKSELRYFSEMYSDEMKRYITGRQRNDRNILIAGIDWDLAQSTPVIVGVELDRNHKDSRGQNSPIFKVVMREEMPRTEFTMDNAISRIIELHSIYDFDWIAADRGYGDVQIEMMKKYGMEHPETLLHEKLIGYHLGSKIEVRDPHTMKKEKKNFKPFMVNNSVRVFERNKIILNPRDKVLRRQLENFRIKSISSNGIPTYTDVDEHSVDAMNLALLCFEQKYGDLMKTILSSRMLGLAGGDPYEGLVPDRSIAPPLIHAPTALGFARNDGYVVNVTGHSRGKRRPSPIKRSFTR